MPKPVVGVKIHTRIPADLLARIDQIAATNGTSRAATIRALLEQAVNQ